MKLFLIRHGQSTGDLEDRYGGTYDDHLTTEGQRQAKALAKQLTGQGIEHLFVSPYHRAHETAIIVGQALGLAPEVVQDIRERNGYGILSGLTKTEAHQRFPQQVEHIKDVHNTPEGGESYADFSKRIQSALKNLAQQPYATIGIITHGGPISLMFRDVFGWGEIKRDDCCFAEIEYQGGQYQVIKTSGISRSNS